MARKETPDVLGEILAGAVEIPEQQPVPARPGPKRKARKPAQRKTEARKNTPEAPPQWEYLVVSLQDYHGWRPRFINGREVSNWMQAPLIHDYLDQLGDDGWELVSASSGKRLYGTSDLHQLYFKKPKRSGA